MTHPVVVRPNPWRRTIPFRFKLARTVNTKNFRVFPARQNTRLLRAALNTEFNSVFFKHVARMVNLTSKIRQIAVIFVIAWASFCDGQKHLGSETRTQYDRYKLVRMTTTELNGDQSKLYSFLTPSKHNNI